jgi:hypothetical protein
MMRTRDRRLDVVTRVRRSIRRRQDGKQFLPIGLIAASECSTTGGSKWCIAVQR